MMSTRVSQDTRKSLNSNLKDQFQEALHMPPFSATQDMQNQTHASILAPLIVVGLDVEQPEDEKDTLDQSLNQPFIEAIAHRLSAIASDQNFPIDIITQLQPDELGLLISLVGEKADLESLAQQFLEALAQPFSLDGQEVRLNASIGIALYPSDTRDINQLLVQARSAMNQARQQGGNCCLFYQPQSPKNTVNHELLATCLELVLDRGDFQTYYQPQFALDTGNLIGAEALVRWRHPKWGVLSPGKFIAIAEETDLIIPLGKWVLRQACEQTKRWQQQTSLPLKIAVNLSARQLEEPSLCESISEILRETGLQAQSLELELTESALMQDVDAASRVMQDLKQLGVSLAIDDFGVGYSSLRYLQKLTFDSIKIDRSFISRVNNDPVNASITAAVINLAHDLNLKVVGEGVETLAERDFLLINQCDIVQGYLLGRPVPSEHFSDFLHH